MLAFDDAVFYTSDGLKRGKVSVSDGKVFLSPRTDIKEVREGKLIIPGLADVHVHLREPGVCEKERIG